MSSNITSQDVLDFWFGSPERSKRRDVWFKKSDAFDREVRGRFQIGRAHV